MCHSSALALPQTHCSLATRSPFTSHTCCPISLPSVALSLAPLPPPTTTSFFGLLTFFPQWLVKLTSGSFRWPQLQNGSQRGSWPQAAKNYQRSPKKPLLSSPCSSCQLCMHIPLPPASLHSDFPRQALFFDATARSFPATASLTAASWQWRLAGGC